MTRVTNPPGTQCYTYTTCLALIKAGTKINFDGASGPLDYNQYHNVFGPYAAFQQTRRRPAGAGAAAGCGIAGGRDPISRRRRID